MIALLIIGLIFAVLVFASKAHELKYQLTRVKSERDSYMRTYEMMMFASRLPADQLRSILSQAEPGEGNHDW